VCKVPVKSSPSTNQHPVSTSRLPFLSPNQQCQSTVLTIVGEWSYVHVVEIVCFVYVWRMCCIKRIRMKRVFCATLCCCAFRADLVVCCVVRAVCTADADTVRLRRLHPAVHRFTQGQGHHRWTICKSYYLTPGL